jgi:hypothetical protein
MIAFTYGVNLLVAFVRKSCGSRLYHVCRGALPDTQSEQSIEGREVHSISTE